MPVPLPLPPAGLLTTEQPLIDEPCELPALKATEAEPLFAAPALALVMLGASGAAAGVMAVD